MGGGEKGGRASEKPGGFLAFGLLSHSVGEHGIPKEVVRAQSPFSICQRTVVHAAKHQPKKKVTLKTDVGILHDLPI